MNWHREGTYEVGSRRLVASFFIFFCTFFFWQPLSLAREKWGAIAYSERTGSACTTNDEACLEAAQTSALECCAEYGPGCAIVLWFRNACGAVARGDSGACGWSSRPSREEACRSAVDACRAGGGYHCNCSTWSCPKKEPFSRCLCEELHWLYRELAANPKNNYQMTSEEQERKREYSKKRNRVLSADPVEDYITYNWEPKVFGKCGSPWANPELHPLDFSSAVQTVRRLVGAVSFKRPPPPEPRQKLLRELRDRCPEAEWR